MTQTEACPVTLLPGLQITGQIGAGRDGTAFSAVRQSDRGTVEVRVFSGIGGDEQRKKRLRQRLRQLSLVNHPAACRVLDVQFDRNPPLAVIEAPGGQPLADFIGGLPTGESLVVLELANQIAWAMAASHRVGLAHGSLSPATVCVSTGKQVRIDFSAAEVDVFNAPLRSWPVASLVRDDANQEYARFSDDVYSVAALLEWLLTREVPSLETVRESVEQTLAAKVSDGGKEEKVSQLCNILERSLSAEYSERPTIRQLACSIQSVLTDTKGGGSTLLNTSSSGSFDPAQDSVNGLSNIENAVRDAFQLTERQNDVARRTTLGRFELREKLGEGGMGAVFKACDPASNEFVALKIVLPEMVRHAGVLERFHKEARLLAEVRHPNVANLLEVNEDDGIHFLAMEYVPGIDLKHFLAREGPLPERLAVELTADILRGLAGAHERSIIHRDIKPANVLLIEPHRSPSSESAAIERPAMESRAADRPQVKVTDFGLARHVDQTQSLQMTQTGMLLGTPHYMAPEQCRGQQELTPATDIYAVGVTLFHMLSGRLPFTADDPMAVANMHCYETPPSLAKLRPDISGATIQIVERALAKDPQSRQNDAQQMLDEIERLLGGEPNNILVHPILPDHNSASLFKADFQWDLVASPEQLWPYVSNTDRINRAVGIPAVTYKSQHDQHRMLHKYADFRMSGLRIAWEELPFEWIEAQRLGVLREFTKGPFKWFLSVVETHRRSDGGTRLRHSVRIAPRGVLGWLVAKLEVDIKGRPKLDQVYRRIDETVSGKLENQPLTDPFESPTVLPKASQRRLDDRIARLEQQGVHPRLVERLHQYLAQAPAQSVARIRPLAWAQQFGVDQEEFLEGCLWAVKVGLLELHWDIICPSCRISAGVKDTLREIERHSYCEVCDVDFELDFSNSIEMIFRAHPEIRAVDLKTYCIGGPEHSPHVVAQMRLMPGERLAFDVQLSPGKYLLRGPQLPYSLPLEVQPIQGVSKADLVLSPQSREQTAPVLRAGRQSLSLTNNYDRQMLIRIERTVSRQDVVTAAQAAARPLFRELFPHEALDPRQLWSIAQLTWLAIEVEDEDGLLVELGDAGAFALLRDFRESVRKAIGPHGGLVIESCVSGLVQCAFEQPRAALRAALMLTSATKQLAAGTKLELRGGMHRGSALVIKVKDRFEYFGQSLNYATQICQRASIGEVILTEELSTDPEVALFLQKENLVTEIVSLDGQPLARRLKLASPFGRAQSA